jgi:hypothetical protein
MAKLTIFQNLSRILGPDGTNKIQPQRYHLDKNQLIKADSKEELDALKLQAQQSKYLQKTWKKVESGLVQQAINYETTRIASYSDFESMEFYPEIAAALDIMMEESTTLNSNGRLINVYSDSTRIKGIVEDLLFNRMDIHTSLPMMTRNVCKYGDNFVYLNIDGDNGVIGIKQMPNYEMERSEGQLQNIITGNNEQNKVKFIWRGQNMEFNSWQIAHFRILGDDRRLPYGTSLLEKARRIWKQLILAEDSMLTYRVIRAPERRVFKINVGNVDPEDVGAYMDEIANRFKRTQQVDPSTGQVDLRLNMMSNDQDYFVPVRDDNAANPIETLPGACIALDTRIPLLDGRVLELQEIIKEWDNGNKDMWVYSVDPNTGEPTVGPITWAGVTRKNTQVLKITLDNGKEVIATPDHKFVHRTKGFTEAQNLVVGDSLMPFYTDTKKIKTNTNGDYHRVWNSATNEWIFTHRLVKQSLLESGLIKEFLFNEKYSGCDKKIIHHKDHNRFNNNPSNLVMMNGGDHMRYHQSVIKETIWGNPEENIIKIKNGVNRFISNQTNEQRDNRRKVSINKSITSRNKANTSFDTNPNKIELLEKRGKMISAVKSTSEFKEKFSIIAKNNWSKKGYKEKVFNKKQTITFSDSLYQMFFDAFNKFGSAYLTLTHLNSDLEFINEFSSDNLDIRSSLTNLSEFTHNHLEKMLKQRGFNNYRNWCKITAEDLGYKNVRAWRYYIQKNNAATVLFNHKIVSIEWLKETQDTGTITVDGEEKYQSTHTFALESGIYIKNSNLDQIADIEYLQRKLFTALRVPKSFLGFDEATGEGKNLALQDIRFSRTINRIQQSLLQELNKIIIIHLCLLGFEDDLDNFTITLNNPSTQAEMLKVEHDQTKITLYKDSVSDAGNGFGAMSMTRGKREILGWSDDEIKQDLLEQRMEKAAAAELANSANVIKHTGMFDIVDRIYGDYDLALKGGGAAPEGGEEGGAGGGGGGGLGGSFGGGGLSGEDLDFDEEGGDDAGAAGLGGEEGGLGGADSGDTATGEASTDAAPEEPAPQAENLGRVGKMLNENIAKKVQLSKKLNDRMAKYNGVFINRLINSVKPSSKQVINEAVKLQNKNLKMNDDINNMIDDIDSMLNK